MTAKLFRFIFSAATITSTFFFSQTSFAYYSLLDTGELLKTNEYAASVEPQWDTHGFNALVKLDTGVTDDQTIRALVGGGAVDFQLGALYKYVPFPDTATQPAIGGSAGIILARVSGATEATALFNPIVSKSFEIEVGDVTPYGSLPIGISWRKDETVIPLQLVGGAKFEPLNLPQWSFFAEVGSNLSHAYGHFSLAAMYRFDEDQLQRR